MCFSCNSYRLCLWHFISRCLATETFDIGEIESPCQCDIHLYRDREGKTHRKRRRHTKKKKTQEGARHKKERDTDRKRKTQIKKEKQAENERDPK